MSEYSTATAAASVSVVRPNRMPPMMMTGIISAQPARPVARTFSRTATGCAIGKPLIFAMTVQRTRKPPASIRPGITPAMNSFTTDWLDSCAYTTIGMDGGMMGPRSAPAAITAPAKPSP